MKSAACILSLASSNFLYVIVAKLQWFTLYSSFTFTCFHAKGIENNNKMNTKKPTMKFEMKKKNYNAKEKYSDDAGQMYEEKFISRFLCLFIISFIRGFFGVVPIYPCNDFRWHELHMNNESLAWNDLVVKIAQTRAHTHIQTHIARQTTDGNLHSKYSKCFPFFGIAFHLVSITFICSMHFNTHAPKSIHNAKFVPILALLVPMSLFDYKCVCSIIDSIIVHKCPLHADEIRK